MKDYLCDLKNITKNKVDTKKSNNYKKEHETAFLKCSLLLGHPIPWEQFCVCEILTSVFNQNIQVILNLQELY